MAHCHFFSLNVGQYSHMFSSSLVSFQVGCISVAGERELDIMVIVFITLAPFILYCWPAVFFTSELHIAYGTHLTALTMGLVRSSWCASLIRTRSKGFSLLGTWAYLCINNILLVVKWTVTSACGNQRFVSQFFLRSF